VKGKKKGILTIPESRDSSRLYFFYFLPTAHFLKQLSTHITKALHAYAKLKHCQRVQSC